MTARSAFRRFASSLAPALALALMATAAPALAQRDDAPAPGPEPRINQLVVYGDDPCPESKDPNEITVCGRMPESERYRIPEIFRDDPNKTRSQSWSARVESLERVGRFGTDSCSPVGLGGFTGCTQSLVRGWAGERKVDNRVDWAKLVEKERQRRLGLIDAEAEAVERQLAAEETARRAREAAREADPETAAVEAEPLPDPVPPPK